MAPPKVKVDVKPSEALVAQAKAEFSVVDAKGRTILLKKPGVLAQFRLVKILGEAAKNEVYMNMVMPMIFVAAIDGEPVHFPQTERQLEALIQQLDDDGVAAVVTGLQENFGGVSTTPEKDKAELKN